MATRKLTTYYIFLPKYWNRCTKGKSRIPVVHNQLIHMFHLSILYIYPSNTPYANAPPLILQSAGSLILHKAGFQLAK